ncbi:MAG: glycosyltransferase family 2 protein [Xanthomarina sp.]
MKVTVVLPIYNGERTLSKTLDSLVAQSYKDFELIASIDGTNDGSEDILKRYKDKFLNLIILKNENNLGLGPNMNRLVANATGDYIAVAEQDDYYMPDRLDKQVKVLDTLTEIGMVSGIAEFCNGETVTTQFPGILTSGIQYPVGKEMFLLNYKHQIKVVNSCMMFRKQVHIDNGLYFTQHYPSISVDWTYVLRFSLVSQIYGIPDVLVKVDRAPDRDSVTSNKNKQFQAARELIRSMAYEYPNIISKKDYKYAIRTELLLEWSHVYGIKFYIKGLWYSFYHNVDKRFVQKVFNRFKQQLNKR